MTRSIITLGLVALGLAVGAAAAGAAPARTVGERAVRVGLNQAAHYLTVDDRPAQWVGRCAPRAGITSCHVVVRSPSTRCTAIGRARFDPSDAGWYFWLSGTRCVDLKPTTTKEARRP